MKYVTFSYDDGVESDITLLEKLQKNSLKATFNLNSGIMTEERRWVFNNSFVVKNLNKRNVRELYSGHEIASHTVHHLDLVKLSREEIIREIDDDRKALEDLFGRSVVGFAYPYGHYNERVLEILKELKIKYARTVVSSYSFKKEENPLLWRPTFHHRDSRAMALLREFVKSEKDELYLSIWGHSYEYDGYNEWSILDSIIETLKDCKNLKSVTNRDFLS